MDVSVRVIFKDLIGSSMQIFHISLRGKADNKVPHVTSNWLHIEASTIFGKENIGEKALRTS